LYSFNRNGAIDFNAQKFRGYVTLAPPTCQKKLRRHVFIVPWNAPVKFEICRYNCFEAICYLWVTTQWCHCYFDVTRAQTERQTEWCENIISAKFIYYVILSVDAMGNDAKIFKKPKTIKLY